MGVHIADVETRWQKFLLWLDKKFNRIVVTECDLCGKPLTVYKTIYKKHKGNLSCSEFHAQLMLR